MDQKAPANCFDLTPVEKAGEVKAVSYTHLDVYTRQPQQGAYQQPAPQPGAYQQPVQGYVPSEAQMKKGMAILAYFGILFLIPLFAAKNDPFARYHTNQGLVLFIFMVIFNILSNVLTNILIEISPMLTLIVSGVFGILTLLLCIFALIGIIRAAKGQMKPLPIIGGIRILK